MRIIILFIYLLFKLKENQRFPGTITGMHFLMTFEYFSVKEHLSTVQSCT